MSGWGTSRGAAGWRLYTWGAVAVSATSGTLLTRPGTAAFAIVLTAAAGAYLLALHRLRALSLGRSQLIACLAIAAIARVPLLLAPPALSNDLYRYIWDGRAQQLGLNPYVAVPADPNLASAHTPQTVRADHQTLPAIYPPGAELFFRAVTSIDDSPRAMKATLVAAEAVLVALLVRFPPGSGAAAVWALGYAWHPLPLLEVAGNGHVDVLGALFLLASASALRRARPLAASLLGTAAVAVKFLPIVLIPLFVPRVRAVHVAAGGALLSALYLPFHESQHLIAMGSLPIYLDRWRFNGPFFGLVEAGLGVHSALAVTIAAGGLWAFAAQRRAGIDSPASWARPIAATLILMPAVFPWYLLWLMPFVAGRTGPLHIWTLTVLTTYVVFDPSPGAQWIMPLSLMGFEYGVVGIAAAAVILNNRRTTRHPGRAPAARVPEDKGEESLSAAESSER